MCHYIASNNKITCHELETAPAFVTRRGFEPPTLDMQNILRGEWKMIFYGFTLTQVNVIINTNPLM